MRSSGETEEKYLHSEKPSSETDPLLHDRCQTLPVPDPDSDNTMHSSPDVYLPSRKWIVEPIGILFCAGIFSQLTILTQYLYYRVGQKYNQTGNSSRAYICNASALVNESEHEMTNKIQSEASEWIVYRSLASSGIAILVVPIYASSSDFLGRKPALLIPCTGLAVDSLGLLLVILLELPLTWLIAFSGLGALGGGFSALFAGVFAFLADTTTRQQRPVRVAIVEGTIFLAGAVVELTVGWWIRTSGYAAPMVFSTSATLANLLYVVLLVPEIRLRRKAIPVASASENLCHCIVDCLRAIAVPFRNIAELFSISVPLAVTFGLLLTALGVFSATSIGISSVGSLYLMNYPFCLDSVLIGYLNAAKIVVLQLGVLIGILFLRRYFGLRPLSLAITGIVSALLGAFATGLASSTLTLFIAAAINLFAMLPVPMLRAYSSQIAPANRQGALFSCIGMMEALGSLAGSFGFTFLYSKTQAWMPGFVYLAVAVANLLALILTCACTLIECCCLRVKNKVPPPGSDDKAESVN